MTSEMAAEFYAAPHFRHRKRYDPIPFAPAHQTVWVNDKMQKKRRYGRRGGKGILQCSGNWWRGINDIPNPIIPWKSE